MRVDTISVLLDRYGQCVTLYRGGVEPGREVRAFLQPLREAGREQARPSPLGLRREDRYLMLGEPDVPAAPGDRVVTSPMEHNAVLRPLRQLERAGVEELRGRLSGSLGKEET